MASWVKVKPSLQISERQQKAIEYIEQHGNIHNKVYQDINQVSKPTATRDLQKLVSLKVIKKTGTSGESIKYMLVGS